MKKLLSLLLVLVTLLGIIPTSAFAADSVEAALGEVDIYNGGYELGYLSINGAVKKQDYTYFMYKGNDGTTREVPAYCVNPYIKGVPQKVEPGESIKYLAEERSSDPKVVGIISNGYPHRSLGELNLDDKYQAYYATKMALWCYLLSTWDINNLKVAPGLSGSELDIGNRILAAAKDIYKRGTTYNYMLTPKMTATPDHSVAYPVSVDGKDYYQQVFTVWSETWVYDYDIRHFCRLSGPLCRSQWHPDRQHGQPGCDLCCCGRNRRRLLRSIQGAVPRGIHPEPKWQRPACTVCRRGTICRYVCRLPGEG